VVPGMLAVRTAFLACLLSRAKSSSQHVSIALTVVVKMHKAVKGSPSQRLSACQQFLGLGACNSWEVNETLKPSLVCWITVTSELAVVALLDALCCCRYFMMYGISPFERAVNEAGGSLALAVIK